MKIGFFGLKEQDKKDFYKNELKDHEVVFLDLDLSEEELPEQSDFEVISVFVQSKVTQKVIDHFPNLKFITVRSTGFDNVDTSYAKTKSILVSNVPSYGSHTVAEFTFGLILSLSRKIPQAISKVKSEGEFDDHEGLKGFDLFGKTIGVVGTGKIGANVIKIAWGFGMKILAFDVSPNDQLAKTYGFKYVSLEELLKNSDIVTIHVPARKETKHMINQQNIFDIKQGALLVNTARGDIVETEALYKAVSQGHLGGVGLDVLEGEDQLDDDLIKEEFEPSEMKNLLENNRIIRNSNVLVTPHTAFYTIEAEKAIMNTTVENILNFIKGISVNIVNG